MQKNNIENTLVSIEEMKLERQQIEKQLYELRHLKRLIQKQFNFEIPQYVIHDIYDKEPYNHVCSIIGLAVENNRISKENAEILKKGLGVMFMNNTFNYDEWNKKYHTKEFINLKNELKDEDIETFKKLGIEIQSKIYTEYEFDVVEGELLRYYEDEEDTDEEDIEFTKPLPKNVTRAEYNKLLEKFNTISDKYKV